MRLHLMRTVFSPDDSTGGAAAAASPATAAPAAAAPPAFADTLPEDIRAHAAFKDIKDLAGLAKGYLGQQQLLGVPKDQLVRLPQSTGDAAADATAWNEVWTKLGRPEKPEGYALKAPDGVAEDPRLKEWFVKAAHDNGLSTKQAAALFTSYNGLVQGAATATQAQAVAAQQQAVAALKTEWGVAFEQNLAAARTAVQHYGGEKLTAELEKTGQGNSPELVRVFARLGAQLREDGIVGRDAGNAVHSPTESQQQINALQGDPAFLKAYQDAKHPGHKDAVAKITRLYEMAHPAA